jgi:biopolymer transport protein ExbD
MRKRILILGLLAAAFTLAGCSRESAATRNGARHQISVTVGEDGSFMVAGQRCSGNELASRLRQTIAGGSTEAVIQNRNVSSNQFMTMAQACDVAGFQRIILGTAIEQGQLGKDHNHNTSPNKPHAAEPR